MRFAFKVAGVFRELGFKKGLIYLLHRGLSRVGGGAYLYEFIAQPVSSYSLLPRGRGDGFLIRQLAYDDPALARMPLDRHAIDHRRKQGAICLAAFKANEIVGYIWLCLGAYREDEVAAIFVPEGCWDFDVYILPDYRLGLAFAKMWDGANEFLRTRHIEWTMSRISALNSRSLAAHAQLHARPIGQALFLRVGPIQLAASHLKPWLRLSVGDKWVPRFRLEAPEDQA